MALNIVYYRLWQKHFQLTQYEIQYCQLSLSYPVIPSLIFDSMLQNPWKRWYHCSNRTKLCSIWCPVWQSQHWRSSVQILMWMCGFSPIVPWKPVSVMTITNDAYANSLLLIAVWTIYAYSMRENYVKKKSRHVQYKGKTKACYSKSSCSPFVYYIIPPISI